MDGVHIVLGASGGVGNAIARLLAEHGLPVRGVNRGGRVKLIPRQVEWAVAEAVELSSLERVCGGAVVIYHCLHPKRDHGLFAPMTRNVIAVAAATRARLVMAGSVFPYGPHDGPLAEDLPYNPVGAIGRAHAEAANLAARAHREGKVQTVIGRASHRYGPFAWRTWPGFDFAAALHGKIPSVIGDLDALHTYTYTDDFARGLITLAAHESAFGRVWHVPSAPPITTRAFLAILTEATRMPLQARTLSARSVIWRSLFSQEMDEARSVLYQFQKPFIVDHSRFTEAFGERPAPTPHFEAIGRTVNWFRRVMNL